ncbi:RNA-directed DNA polymerase, eukaryota [Tanacetum coccineum]
MAARYRSNEDDTRSISKSIFVTNFPDSTTSNDLWKLCQGYGSVVDVYIPNRKSKAGKHFAFVRFIRVDNNDRLVGNLCTLWIGRMHLHANLNSEGFQNVKLAYLGGLWVMIEEPYVMVDIEGVPLHAWSRATFNKIGSKWGEVMELEESKDDLFARKRICIMTKQEDNILEKFKIIIKGKNFVIRAKELFVWSMVFKVDNEVVYCTDDESVKGTGEDKGEASNKLNSDAQSDGEGVSDTYFGDNDDNLGKDHTSDQPLNGEETSHDPFNIYDLLRKQGDGVINSGSDKSIPFPPGFTPEKVNHQADVQEVKDTTPELSHSRSEGLCSRVLEGVQHNDDQLSSGDRSNGHNGHNLKKGGSILEVVDDMIKVGQTMGYTMDGCMKDMERIIGSQGVHDVIQ